MKPATSLTSVKASQGGRFYSFASIALLVLTLIGFRMFYLEGKAFPGRPLTPPIHTLLMVHGVLMTIWMLLAVVQPLLVARGRKRLHMSLGRVGAVLAAVLVFVGLRIGIEATRVNPPEMQLFGLTSKQFMAVPVLGILTFGGFVLAGVIYRRRPEIHRPMMLMASLSVVSAALGRIPVLNGWYAGTVLETLFSANLITVLLGVLMLAWKCIASKAFDRWFALAVAALTAISIVIAVGAKTAAWAAIASFLLR